MTFDAKTTDLDDAKSPEHVVTILRNAAQRYRDSVSELAGEWQDENAGKVWSRIARDMDRLAERVAMIVATPSTWTRQRSRK